jgi:Flp pilus assembly protein CpaB
VKKKSPPYAIIGAIVLGCVAVYIYFQIQAKQEAEKQAEIQKAKDDAAAEVAAAEKSNQPVVTSTPTDMRGVLYATQPLEPGVRISSAFFETKLTPNEILPDAYTSNTDVVGWFATRKIEKGDPLTPRNVGKSLPYLSQRISPGMRMVSLPVFNASANSTGGFVVDGDSVDLLYTAGGVTSLALQNVKVAYVPGPTIQSQQIEGVNPAPAPDEKLAVTFEVTPEEAQMLVNLTSGGGGGSFSMILRARSDTEPVKIKPFNSSDFSDNLTRLQRVADKSNARVEALAAQIAAEEKKNQGTSNDTTPPTNPTP